MMDFLFNIISFFTLGQNLKNEAKTLVQTIPTDRRKK